MPDVPRPGLRRARILVVDDEPDIGVALRDLLETSYEAQVTVCTSGEAALRHLRTGGFDLFITDYKMPGMNGLQLIDAARAVAPGVGHILVTAFDRELITKLARGGTHERFLRKPLEPEQVLGEVEASLGKQS